MTHRTERFRLHLSLALAVTLFMTACTGAKGGAKNDTFYGNLGGEPTTINPITSTDYYASQVQGYVIESLLSRDPDTYDWKPALADKWEISPDGKVFTFHLRPGVLWQDGKPLTVEDVKFSFDVIFDPKYPTAHIRPYYEGIEKAEIVDPQTVRFYTREKYFRNFESVAGLNVLAKHIYEGSDKDNPTLNKTLVGTGPYILEKYERGTRIVLKKSDNWWGNNAPEEKGEWNFSRIVLRFVEDSNIAMQMFKKGELDFLDFRRPEEYVEQAVGPEFGKTVFKVQTTNKSPKPWNFVAWNLRSPLFADRNVRLALAHLMNRELMIQKFRYGLSVPAVGPWHQASEYASPNVKPVEYNPKKALELLHKAGWSDSDKDGVLDKVINGKKTPFKFTLLLARKDNEKYLTMYKEDARQMGVDIDVKLVEWNSFIKLINERKFDAVQLSWAGGGVDVDPKQVWHSSSTGGGGSNFGGYKNPEVDRLIDQARAELDKKKRIPMMQKIYELIAYDQPYAFMFNDKFEFYAHSKRMKHPKDTYNYVIGVSYWSLDKGH